MKVQLPREKIEAAVRMREETGASYARIARKYGCSPGAIAWHCLKEGADAPNARPLSGEIKGPLVVTRGNHTVRRFTPQEDESIESLLAEGKTTWEIAKAIGRPFNSTRGREMTLARRQRRAEEQALHAAVSTPSRIADGGRL